MCRQPAACGSFFEVADRAMVTCIDHKQIMGFTDRQVSQRKDETLKMLSFSLVPVLYSPLKFLENKYLTGETFRRTGRHSLPGTTPAMILPFLFLLKARYRRGPTEDKQIWTNLKELRAIFVRHPWTGALKRAKPRWENSTNKTPTVRQTCKEVTIVNVWLLFASCLCYQ